MTDAEQRTTFFGIPVSGDIIRGETQVDQRPDEEFAPILQAVLNRPEITAVRWEQYTPYFNDGDACTFGINDISVKFAQDTRETPEVPEEEQWATELEAEARRLRGLPPLPDDDEDDDDDESGWYESYKFTSSEGRYPDIRRIPDPSMPYPAEAIIPLIELNAAVAGGEFYTLLLRTFGDHARVTVTRDGIQVDEYSHD